MLLSPSLVSVHAAGTGHQVNPLLGSRDFPLKTTSAGVPQVQWLDMCSLLVKAGFYIINWPKSLAFPYTFRSEKNKGLATIGEDNYWAFYTAIKSSQNPLDLIRAGPRTKGSFSS
jgi:hypothetical protein